MISDVLVTITQVGMLVFIVASMAAMGLGLTISQIVEPLRDARMVLLLLAVNFVVVPIVAIGAARLLPMGDDSATAVIIIGCCAGAPFLPRLALLAKGSPALSVGAMVLLMVVTVAYAPVVVPLVVEGAQIDPWDIASSLILFMLVPLGIGLAIKARYAELADSWVHTVGQISSVAMLLGVGAALFVSWRDIVGAIGSWIFIGTSIVLIAGLATGYLAGVGRSQSDKTVLGFATAQRNISAAIVVATSLGGNVLVLTLVGALIIPIVLIILAAELGKRVADAVGSDPAVADPANAAT
jgi:BASS family bile acid:Na+ symporter